MSAPAPDPFAKIRNATNAHRAKHGCSAFPYSNGPLLAALGRLVNKHRWAIVIIGVVIIALSVAGIFEVRVETDMLQMFGQDTQFRRDAEFINDNFAGTTTMQVVIRGDGQDAVITPEILHKIDSLQRYLEQFSIVGNTQSIADMVKEMNQVINDGSPDYYLVPDSRELVSQYLLLLSFSGGGDALERFLDFNHESANVTAFLRSSSMSEMQELTRNIDAYLEEHFRSAGIQADVTGGMAILTALNDLLISSQIRSLFISLALVLVITSVLFRSVVMGMLSIIPLTVEVEEVELVSGRWYRVLATGFQSAREAEINARRLKAAGKINEYVIQKININSAGADTTEKVPPQP